MSVCACCDLYLFSIFFFKKERKEGRKKEEMFMASISECDEQR